MNTTTDIEEFSDRQIQDWRDYVVVQKEGQFNMFDPRARELTGLDRDAYIFVMSHYDRLAAAAKAQDDHIMQLAERHGH